VTLFASTALPEAAGFPAAAKVSGYWSQQPLYEFSTKIGRGLKAKTETFNKESGVAAFWLSGCFSKPDNQKLLIDPA
jgi:hypothetical protein